ncbi:unnamed protein product [Rodentolepis nana]|uniref:MKRN2 opposite strand protein-like C-terminal domain-containing protein n=1 Tax=Rodentolepis nana TaxID=102285 RepID=A0A0R3TPD9_RODNA|nr:unnamed protein product [Rodentolepis nana]
MLKSLYQFRTKCCGKSNVWQYSAASRILPCQFCGTIGDFTSLPCEISPPTNNAHTAVFPGSCPVRVAFIPSDINRGFLNFEVGDELHCGIIDTSGCVISYVPKERRFQKDRSNQWKQSIVCEIAEIREIDGPEWNHIIETVSNEPKDVDYDCLEFAIEVLNRVSGKNEFSRENLSEIMGRQLFDVMEFAKMQRKALRFRRN